MTVTVTDLRPAADGDALRSAYSCFPSGVVAVCAEIDGVAVGMAASSFATVSLDPPLVSLCVQHTSSTWPKLRDAPSIGVSVFSAGQDALCRQLAGAADHRFDGVTPAVTDSGALFVPDAAAILSCTLYNEIPAGDHNLVLLEITALDADPDIEPLVFHASTFRALEARA
ncbi:flavin reductase family protein [Williamsia herbipolensis]|uniref:Flavin reductase family protein n=1 Tax=Williamsia herbipolensis TaxID=1603258 RepID=A0AAU4K0S7_9NOCA|nr:flavin reductase family protein [Williamsia herbipolensis]MCX6467852.1 flavin reductase family protein [Mycobacteriales bacterium]